MVDEEIEKAILHYIIFDDEDFEVTEKDFVKKENQKIIKAINELKTKKQEISMLTINNKIDSDNKNILVYLSELGEYIRRTNPDTAYKILKNNTKKRETYQLAREIQTEIKEIENIDIYIEKIISRLEKIQAQMQEKETFVELVSKTAELIERNINRKKNYDFYTGFFDLDGLTDGLHDGELTIIGARPGVGKTTFSLQRVKDIECIENVLKMVKA